MAIKHKDVEKQVAAETGHKGPWGEIVHTEHRYIHFIREVRSTEECWSYPYETLLRRVFKKSNPEEIEIMAGGDTITIRGYGLEKLLEPLEKRWLVRVEQQTMRFGSAEASGRRVTEIKIESSR